MINLIVVFGDVAGKDVAGKLNNFIDLVTCPKSVFSLD